MEIPHKGGYGIVNYNPSPLVPKQDTFYVTDGSPQVSTQFLVEFSKFNLLIFP